jgi:subtilisin family serine protease
MDRLTGADLLLAIRAAGSVSRAQLLRLTGYVRLQADGTEVADTVAFNNALLEAARGSAVPQPPQNLESINDEIARNMVRTVIALPLLDRLNEETQRRQQGDPTPPRVYDVIIGLHQDFPKGRETARRWVIETIEAIIQSRRDQPGQAPETLDAIKRKFTRQYLFATLTGESIRQLVRKDREQKQQPGVSENVLSQLTDRATQREWRKPVDQPAIFQIWEDFRIYPLLHGSVATVKADAARASFGASGKGIVWAVIDSGIQAGHPHFAEHDNLHGLVDEWHADFTGEQQPLLDAFGHGTHVAGIIAGEISAPRDDPATIDNPGILAYTRSLKADEQQVGREITCDRLPLGSIRGVAPEAKLVSLKVIDSSKQGSVSNIIAALARVQEINANGRNLRIHGINLSVGYPFDPEWFACGQSQLCVEVNRLVRSGVVVVVAAGNTGYGSLATAFNGPRAAGLALSINDPGNAEAAITVGSTHRTMPHTYGVSYFSSKGPTGDGRLKPDLVAPGEKVLSCGAGEMASRIAEKVGNGIIPNYVEDSGTSMAAPHVSGAAAAFLSIRNEFIGKPEMIKQIFMSTATDLGRERQFQGAGLLDLMRAIQSL